jgi:hypothetical protein
MVLGGKSPLNEAATMGFVDFFTSKKSNIF